MSGVTEIYICKAGQELKEGKLVYSDEITDKYHAEADAKQRCADDKTIAKIGYYSVSESGNFRNFFTYENLECAPAPPVNGKGAKPNGAAAKAGGARKKASGTGKMASGTFVSRVLDFFTEEVKH